MIKQVFDSDIDENLIGKIVKLEKSNFLGEIYCIIETVKPSGVSGTTYSVLKSKDGVWLSLKIESRKTHYICRNEVLNILTDNQEQDLNYLIDCFYHTYKLH